MPNRGKRPTTSEASGEPSKTKKLYVPSSFTFLTAGKLYWVMEKKVWTPPRGASQTLWRSSLHRTQKTLPSCHHSLHSPTSYAYPRTIAMTTRGLCFADYEVLALDMDSTIIVPASGRVFPKDANDWKLMLTKIPEVLKRYDNEGFKVVILSNQSSFKKDRSKLPEFQVKVQEVVAKLGLPIQVFLSLQDDMNRKPRTGLWQALERQNGGIEVIKEDSIYCGDAAGREATGTIKKDHSCSDRLFAANVGVPFKTPEELWNDKPCNRPLYSLSFDPKKDLADAVDVPMPSFSAPTSTELLLMVGLPACGKSTFCKNHLEKLGYKIVSRDVTGTVEKCLKQTSSFLSAGQSVVVDNTNVDVESRSRFLAIAKQMNMPARALVMTTSPGNSRHNEMFRRLTGSSHDKINDMVFNMMKSKYKEPTTAEGFTEILKIPFVPAPPDHLHDLYYQYLLEK